MRDIEAEIRHLADAVERLADAVEKLTKSHSIRHPPKEQGGEDPAKLAPEAEAEESTSAAGYSVMDGLAESLILAAIYKEIKRQVGNDGKQDEATD